MNISVNDSQVRRALLGIIEKWDNNLIQIQQHILKFIYYDIRESQVDIGECDLCRLMTDNYNFRNCSQCIFQKQHKACLQIGSSYHKFLSVFSGIYQKDDFLLYLIDLYKAAALIADSLKKCLAYL